MDVELKEHETLIIHEIHNNQVLYSIEYLNEKEMERYTQSVHIYDVENEDDSVINLSEKGKFLLDNACFYKDKVFLLYNEGYEYDHKFTYFNDENIKSFIPYEDTILISQNSNDTIKYYNYDDPDHPVFSYIEHDNNTHTSFELNQNGYMYLIKYNSNMQCISFEYGKNFDFQLLDTSQIEELDYITLFEDQLIINNRYYLKDNQFKEFDYQGNLIYYGGYLDENILLFDQNTIYIYNNNMELITTSELEQSFYQYINDEGNTYIILQDQDGQPIIYTFEYNPIQ